MFWEPVLEAVEGIVEVIGESISAILSMFGKSK